MPGIKRVAELKLHHQLEQLILHAGIYRLKPNATELCACERASCGLYFRIVEHAINRFCAPGGFQHDSLFQQRIVLEVKTDTEIMQVSAQLELVFVTGE